MAFVDICIGFYVITTLIAIGMTYRERRRSGRASLAVNVISLLACMVWPVLAVIFLFNPLIAGQDGSTQGRSREAAG